jgi:hypothetical protein
MQGKHNHKVGHKLSQSFFSYMACMLPVMS